MKSYNYYEILKKIKYFIVNRNLQSLWAFEDGYFIGSDYVMVTYSEEEVKEKIADYFYNLLKNEYSLLFLSNICDNKKISEIYLMTINSFGFVKRLIDEEKQFDTMIDLSVSLYDLIIPLINLEKDNISDEITDSESETIIIDGKLVKSINQLNEYIECTKDKNRFIDHPNKIKEKYLNIFDAFAKICFYNSYKNTRLNIIIENEEFFLKENEKDKKVFYALISTYKNILDNKAVFIHPKYNIYENRVKGDIIITI